MTRHSFRIRWGQAQRSVGALFASFRIGAGREFDDATGVCLKVEDG
jgi:hypothetical protein